MKKVIIEIGLFFLSIVLFFLLQFVSDSIVRLLYGESDTIYKQHNLWSILFAGIQIIILILLYINKVLYKRIITVILSTALIILLTDYFVYMSA